MTGVTLSEGKLTVEKRTMPGYVLASDRGPILRQAASQYDEALAGTLGR